MWRVKEIADAAAALGAPLGDVQVDGSARLSGGVA